MTGRRRRTRKYLQRGRYYGDFRDYADVGGKREALIPEGERYATTDSDTADQILGARLDELKALRKGLTSQPASNPRLKDYAKRHLDIKSQYRRASTCERDELSLRNIVGYFGENVRLREITVARLTDYLQWRKQQPGKRKQTVSAQTLRHELNALSNLYKRAVVEGGAEINPVSLLLEKPEVDRGEAVWLEISEGAKLLKATLQLDGAPASRAIPYAHPLTSTFLHTGGRGSEIFGLERRDIDFEKGRVHIRPNSWRQLKRKHHERWVPLWPDLHATLTEYLERFDRNGLLFPSETGGMLTDIRGTLNRAVEIAEIDKRVTRHTLRHTYASVRLQTLDNGAPVSIFTVAKELGHKSIDLIEKTYGHLLEERERLPIVRYRETKVIPLRHERAAS